MKAAARPLVFAFYRNHPCNRRFSCLLPPSRTAPHHTGLDVVRPRRHTEPSSATCEDQISTDWCGEPGWKTDAWSCVTPMARPIQRSLPNRTEQRLSNEHTHISCEQKVSLARRRGSVLYFTRPPPACPPSRVSVRLFFTWLVDLQAILIFAPIVFSTLPPPGPSGPRFFPPPSVSTPPA